MLPLPLILLVGLAVSSAAFSAPAPPSPRTTAISPDVEPTASKATHLLRSWWPVTLEECLDATRPNAVELLGKTLVLYHSGDEWNCLEDRCSHRFAPLSEGRVVEGERGTEKLLQCAYHGWEFRSDGSLDRVPQQRIDGGTPGGAGCGGKVQNYPVRTGAGMIWVWADAANADEAAAAPLPVSNLLTEYVQDYPNSGFMRDLPYGYELLAENLVDVSHLPWSHHGTGGFDRGKAQPLDLRMMAREERAAAAVAEAEKSPMYHGEPLPTPLFQAAVQNASQTDPTLIMLAGMGRPVMENATSSSAFYAPSHIRYRRILSGSSVANIELFLCPTGPGKSRVFLFTAIERVLKRSLAAAVEEQKGFFGRLKQRFINSRIKVLMSASFEGHAVSHDIFDGDGLFLQKQGERMERYELTPGDYYTPTTADVLVLTMRRWLSASAALTAAAGHEGAARAATGVGAYDPLQDRTRSQMLNRYETHTKHCPICLESLAKLNRRKKMLMTARTILLGSIGASSTAPLWVGSLTRKIAAAAVAAAVSSLLADRQLKKIEDKIQKHYYVDYVHAEK